MSSGGSFKKQSETVSTLSVQVAATGVGNKRVTLCLAAARNPHHRRLDDSSTLAPPHPHSNTPSDSHTALKRAVDTPHQEAPLHKTPTKAARATLPRRPAAQPRTVARPLSLGLPVELGHPPHPRRRPHQVHHLPQRKVRVHRRVAPQPPHILGEAGGAGAAEAEAR